jgi:hypothetical protein
MSNRSTRAPFPAADFSSENSVRGVFGRRRRTTPTNHSERPDRGPAKPSRTGQATSPPTARSAPLRRWSVAELVARAAAAPRSTT